ncbi:MAG: thiamine phosphate synthase [Pseudomonadota bacterium]
MMDEKAESDPKGKFRRAEQRIRRHFPNHLPPLLALTDPKRTPDPTELARRLPRGCGLVYRHFGSDNRLTIAEEIAEIAKARGLCFLIGNDPDLARQTNADGVHWPETQMASARKWRDSFYIMTCAAHSRSALARAERLPLDAALVSTIFMSRSPTATPPLGTTRARSLSRKCRLPVYALGGIRARNISRIASFAGAASIDGISDAYTARI